MKKRWVVLGAAAIMVLGPTVGIAVVAGRGSGGTEPPDWRQTQATCDALHESAAMRQMREQMPTAARARCEAIHEQMDQMLGRMGPTMVGSGMMGGSGMGSSGMMNGSGAGLGMMGGSMADHHSGTLQGKVRSR